MLGRERADHAEGRQVDALDLQPGALDGGGGALDHLAAHGHDDDARAQARRRLHDAERLEVQHGLVHRHRDVVGSGGAHGGGELLRVVDHGGEVERADDDALVGDAEPHPLGQVVLGEERLQRLGERDRVDDLAVAHDAGLELGDRAAGQCDGAIDADLGGGEVAGVELEPDDAGLGGTLLAEHDDLDRHPRRAA